MSRHLAVAATALACLALPPVLTAAQTIPPDHFKKAPEGITLPVLERELPTERPPVTSVPGRQARLRGLDKMTGQISTFDLAVGESMRYERLEITLKACRHPGPGEGEDAFAYLVIRDVRHDGPDFAGWMFASSPALSALDHPRYDVWVLSCSTSSDDAVADSDQN
ncbi:MAG: DUF2155 domain-containing protein [Alphaproteobacteria bacterium]|nr:MAG: DUF2155 domain-containing protein [Alphaproteobacteria bacterium]